MDWTVFRDRMRQLDPRTALIAQHAHIAEKTSDPVESAIDAEFLSSFSRLQTGDLDSLEAVFLDLHNRSRSPRQKVNAADALGRYYEQRARILIAKGDLTNAQPTLETAAQWFTEAGEPDRASTCQAQSIASAADLTGNLDPLLKLQLTEFHSNLSGIALLQHLDGLLEATARTGDRFETLSTANKVSECLRDLQLLDPCDCGVDHAVESWFSNSPATDGTSYFGAICLTLQAYLRLLAARLNDARHCNAPVAALQRVFDELALSGLSTELARQRQSVADEIDRAWAEAYPRTVDSEQQARDRFIREAQEHALDLQQKRNAFEREYNAIDDANEARDWEVDRSDLIARISDLQTSAAQLEYDFYISKALQLHAQILYYLRQNEAAAAVLDRAKSILLNLKAEKAGNWTNVEKDSYEMLLRKKLDTLAATGNNEAISDLSDEAIGFVESRRYLLNNVERQSAFMDWRNNFYIYGIAAARHLGQWDKLLQHMELLKGRTLIRTALSPDPPLLSESQILEQFKAVTAELQSGTDSSDLQARRRQLWDLLALSHTQSQLAADPPTITVAAVQNALAEDEVAISFFKMARDIFLAILVTRDRFHVERIAFTSAQAAEFTELVAGIQALDSFTEALAEAVAAIGPLLLPASLRTLMEGKSRLIISAHGPLHVFPFGAVPWDGAFLGLRFALRYAPNLSSLLIRLTPSSGEKVLALGIRNFATPLFKHSPLKLAETEASEVATLYRNAGIPADLLVPPKASRANFCNTTLASYRCLHLATHGTSVFGNETLNHPLESRIILEDGWIDGLEIATLKLNADLVVLSACNSGQRAIGGRGLDDLPADDVFGIQSALMGSGARAILGALWPLGDEAGYELITRFHKHHALGAAPDRALQSALIDYTAQCPQKDPFYWAPWFITTLGHGSGAKENVSARPHTTFQT